MVDIITVADQPTPRLRPTDACQRRRPCRSGGRIGSPSIRLLGGPLNALSPVYGYKTLDLCNGADPVCSNGDDVAAHSPYVQSGLAAQAAQFVADRVTIQAPISRLAGQSQG